MKTKTIKRILSGLLALMMVITGLPITPISVSAAGHKDTECSVPGCGGTYRNGFCSVCDGYQEPTHYLTEEETPVYDLYNEGNLYWFANHVNTDEFGPLSHAELRADIVVNPQVLNEDGELAVPASQLRSWTPIASLSIAEASFLGKLFGNSHSISGLYCVTDNHDGAGLLIFPAESWAPVPEPGSPTLQTPERLLSIMQMLQNAAASSARML